MSQSANRGKVVINPEHVRDSDGTVRNVLTLWSCRADCAVQYNAFQAAYFALIRELGFSDEGAVEEENAAARQTRIRAMYQEIQTELWGPDFRAQAALASGSAVGAVASTQGEVVEGSGTDAVPRDGEEALE